MYIFQYIAFWHSNKENYSKFPNPFNILPQEDHHLKIAEIDIYSSKEMKKINKKHFETNA